MLAVVQDMALVVDVALVDPAQAGAHLEGHLPPDPADLEPVEANRQWSALIKNIIKKLAPYLQKQNIEA